MDVSERSNVMTTSVEKRNVAVKELLNSTYSSLTTVIPIEHKTSKPQLLDQQIHLNFGVLIGITGDIKGKLLLSGELSTFSNISMAMFSMPVEGEMLTSFSGELGNMIAGNISTHIVQKGVNMDITHPTIIQGNTELKGYKQALKITVEYENTGDMDICLLLD